MPFMRNVGYSIYGIYDSFGVRQIIRLRLGFRYLREHKCRKKEVKTFSVSKIYLIEADKL